MVLGGVLGIVVGALGHSFVLPLIRRLLSLWDSGVRTLGDIPISVSSLEGLLARGVVIFGSVKGYWIVVEQYQSIGALVVFGVLMLTGVVVVLMREG